MDSDRFRECLASIGWSGRKLADMLAMDERQVRRWAAGSAIPQPVADWLEKLAHCHEHNPPPAKDAP